MFFYVIETIHCIGRLTDMSINPQIKTLGKSNVATTSRAKTLGAARGRLTGG